MRAPDNNTILTDVQPVFIHSAALSMHAIIAGHEPPSPAPASQCPACRSPLASLWRPRPAQAPILPSCREPDSHTWMERAQLHNHAHLVGLGLRLCHVSAHGRHRQHTAAHRRHLPGFICGCACMKHLPPKHASVAPLSLSAIGAYCWLENPLGAMARLQHLCGGYMLQAADDGALLVAAWVAARRQHHLLARVRTEVSAFPVCNV